MGLWIEDSEYETEIGIMRGCERRLDFLDSTPFFFEGDGSRISVFFSFLYFFGPLCFGRILAHFLRWALLGGDLSSHYHFAVVVAVSRLPDNGASSKDVGDCFVWICFVRDVD